MPPSPDGAIPPSASPAADQMIELQVQRVHKSFDDNDVLRGVDLSILRGEMVAIVGGSGCGKTVLLELMTGQEPPDAGRVLVANHEMPGTPLADLALLDDDSLEDIRLHWSIVFQRNALFSGTVYENIALWLTEVRGLAEADVRRRVQAAVTAVGLDPGRVLEQDREELSGGMAKRVAIARAIAMDPALIFYDEPTTGLDPRHSGKIHELIAETHWSTTAAGEVRTTVVITHDKDLLRRVEPRIVMIDEGRVVFDGAYRTFAQTPSELIRPYFELMPLLQRGAGRA